MAAVWYNSLSMYKNIETLLITIQYNQFSSTLRATITVVTTLAQVVNESIYGSLALVVTVSKYPEITVDNRIRPMAIKCCRVVQIDRATP